MKMLLAKRIAELRPLLFLRSRFASVYLSIGLILLGGCTYYEDDFQAVDSGSVVFTEEGYVSATFLHRRDSLFLTVANISGADLGKLSFLVELFDDPLFTRESLQFTKLFRIDSVVAAGAVLDVGYIYSGHPRFAKNTTRLSVISLQSQDLFNGMAGLLSGKYVVTDTITRVRNAFLINGFIDYSGEFTFSPQSTENFFHDFRGKVETSGSCAGNFFGNSQQILSTVQSSYTLEGDSVIVEDLPLSSQYYITLRLKHIN